MPSRYREGIEGIGRTRPNSPVFNDQEPILEQIIKMWMIREQLRQKGYKVKPRQFQPPLLGGELASRPLTLAELLGGRSEGFMAT
ncbi:MAG: hypothetical protein ISS63_00675 [Desulfobacteraceae bacterium]|nr:hypothetical protein [Desulfobacteraceae bacterium]